MRFLDIRFLFVLRGFVGTALAAIFSPAVAVVQINSSQIIPYQIDPLTLHLIERAIGDASYVDASSIEVKNKPWISSNTSKSRKHLKP